MLRVTGYRVWDRIHKTSHSEVYTGSRISDGARVVMKRYASRSGKGSDRAERELQLLQRILSPSVVRPIELCGSGDDRVLVVERFSGIPLSRHVKGPGLAPGDFLWIALGIARALADVHDARIIHKDIKLSNILVDDDEMRICVIDFGISSEFGRAEHVEPPDDAEGTMHYIAPEQTGRVENGVDFRTDLYSLGASLYELLTGKTPFRNLRGLDLVHAHIAIRPRSAVDRVRSVEVALSRIVDKLLEKDPERRYQTARGLAADLETCQKQLELDGEIDPDLELGTADASDRLRFPSDLYGREAETEALLSALQRVSRGSCEVVLLAGPAGIGKSSIPNVLREPLVRTHGFLAHAKFDVEGIERPYGGFATAIQGLVAQILCLDPQRFSQWANTLEAELGAIGGALYPLAPALEHLVKDFPELPRVGINEQRERLALAVSRLFGAIARTAHPTVLFLDDLQWADPGSLGLLGSLLQWARAESLLVVGTYRDNEVGPDHALSATLADMSRAGVPLQTIEVAPLTLAATSAMLANALGRSIEDTEWLARRVGLKSQHNPLLVRRLMFHLWDRDLIRYEHGTGWSWDEEKLTEAEITDDAAEMVADRIDALSQPTRCILTIASLLGTAFDVEMLVALSGDDRLDVLQQLMELVEQGLITPCSRGFKFVHDRIREASQSRLAAEERAALHLAAAHILDENTPEGQLGAVVFEIAEHFVGAGARLDEADRARALEILHLAGSSALGKGAVDNAAYYLARARDLLADEDWERTPELAASIALDGAEAAIQTRSYALARAVLDDLVTRRLSPLSLATAISKGVTLRALTGEDAVGYALEGLAEFGLHWPRNPSRLRMHLELLRIHWTLRGPAERMFPGNDPSVSAFLPLLITTALSTPLADRSTGLTAIIVCHGLRLMHRHSPISPALALTGLAALCIVTSRSPRLAHHYARAAEYWATARPDPVRNARARIGLIRHVHASTVPRRQCVEALEAMVKDASELGDRDMVVAATLHMLEFGALVGTGLERLLSRLDGSEEILAKPSVDALMRRSWELLRTASLDTMMCREALDAMLRLIELKRDVTQEAIHAVAAFCFLGRYELADELLRELRPVLLEKGDRRPSAPEYAFYQGLMNAALCEGGLARDRRGRLRAARRGLRDLRKWARSGRDFRHMAALLEAEIERARGRLQTAARLYEAAGQRAREVGYDHHAALAAERRAEVLARQHRDTEAEAARATAVDLYQAWGALAKVSELGRLSDPPGADSGEMRRPPARRRRKR